MALPALVQAMLDPAFYPHRPERVELRQTHISYVLLAGDQVFKLKKPVRFTFLDFSTLELRRHCCHEEVRLNRRLAADVYLGVVGIAPRRAAAASDAPLPLGDPASAEGVSGGGFRLCAEDDPAAVEYAVHMRRLDDADTLESRVASGAVRDDEIDALAALLVDFHRGAAGDDEVTAQGEPAAILRVLQDNWDGVAPFRGATIAADDDDAIQRAARAFLARRSELFRRRQRERRVRDGHGDLHLDHVYLTRPIRIVDCVEFNPRFRRCDVASDLAFLVMDLDFHRRSDLGARLVERYVALSGDRELPVLLPFYAAYRAYVRGKVASLKSAESEVEPAERERARREAARRFALALRYTRAYAPRLVVVAGLSGTGKSSVARALAARSGHALLASDEIRKQLAGLAPTARVGERERAALYSEEMSRRTYAELFARAERALAEGDGAILDATFQQRLGRDQARALAHRLGVPLLLVECRADDELVRRRLTERARRNDDPSDADWDVYLEQKRRAEPLGDDEPRLVLDTRRSVEDSLEAIWSAA